MAFEPIAPAVHYPPLKVAEDTWLIQQMQRAVIGPLWVYLHSLVIKGAEPILVDTGTPVNRRAMAEGRLLDRRSGRRAVDLSLAR